MLTHILYREKEGMMEYVYQYDNLQRQLQLLQYGEVLKKDSNFNKHIPSDANRKLQDTNDHIQGMVDMPAIAMNSPMPPRRNIQGNMLRFWMNLI